MTNPNCLWVGLKVSMTTAESLSFTYGGPVDPTKHITLFYGEVVTPELVQSVEEGLAELCMTQGPFYEEPFGFGTFNPQDPNDMPSDRESALVLLIQVTEQLLSFRQAVAALCSLAAVESHDHWIPHLTLAFGTDVTEVPLVDLLQLNHVEMSYNDASTTWELTPHETIELLLHNL